MPRPPKWSHQLQASKNEVLLAVDLYNSVTNSRRLEAFIVHMQIGWLYLLQAKFERDGVDFWERDQRGRRVRGEDGEFRSWPLRKSLAEEFPNPNHPIRQNVEFFVGLRDKIEHRYADDIEPIVAGKSQSLILNYERCLVDWFGEKEGIADRLRFPVFLSSLSQDAVAALKATYSRLPKKITSYVEGYDAAVSEETRADQRYDFRVFLIPQTGPKSEADVAMRFVRVDGLPREQQEKLEIVQTIVRDRQVPVGNLNRYKPSEVSHRVEEATGFRFSPSWDHVKAWRYYEVRPPDGDPNPEQTKSQFCVWDEPHGDYVYTDAWVKKLVKELKDPAKFERIIGKPPWPVEGRGEVTVLASSDADRPK
ncbi:MAG: hypothetical protein QOE56_2569 [Solirubrobacterales bacterium]|nr:hypothetical protein [Solirubrobacterales bacterium]